MESPKPNKNQLKLHEVYKTFLSKPFMQEVVKKGRLCLHLAIIFSVSNEAEMTPAEVVDKICGAHGVWTNIHVDSHEDGGVVVQLKDLLSGNSLTLPKKTEFALKYNSVPAYDPARLLLLLGFLDDVLEPKVPPDLGGKIGAAFTKDHHTAALFDNVPQKSEQYKDMLQNLWRNAGSLANNVGLCGILSTEPNEKIGQVVNELNQEDNLSDVQEGSVSQIRKFLCEPFNPESEPNKWFTEAMKSGCFSTNDVSVG